MARKIDNRAHWLVGFGVFYKKHRNIGVYRTCGADNIGVANAGIGLICSVFHQIYAVE